MGKWICKICGYIYDEEKEGRSFASLPDTWVCPLCGASKASFALQGAEEAQPKPAPAPIHQGMERLSAGALAALCSNLARGCEKQYKDQEAALFREIAGFFAAAAPQVENGDLDRLAAMVQEDLDAGYPALRASAQGEGDRGALRICTWGEKVTGILSTLLKRYQQEGESLLENTQVWVCTVCGFIYIGDQAPALCPVCKVPAWKFEEIEGRG